MFSTIIAVFLVITIYHGAAENFVPLYRYVHPITNLHFYTVRADEIGTITPGAIGRHGYRFEGVACGVFDPSKAQLTNTIPLYRYCHIRSGQHFYTNSWQEIGSYVYGVTIGSWRSEGIAAYIYSSKQAGTHPLYRYSHHTGFDHFYTTNTCEIGTVIPGLIGKHGYKYEGIVGYVVPAGPFSPSASVCS